MNGNIGRLLGATVLGAALCGASLTAQGVEILANNSSTGYGLQNSFMTGFRTQLTATNTLATTGSFTNLAEMNGYDAIWVNDQTSALSSTQMSNITSYLSAGHKAVFITDNMGWAAWNNSIETMLGASITDACASSNGTALVNNQFTAGVTTFYGSSCNSLINSGSNMTMLFSNNMAGVYKVGAGEALLITSVDILGNLYASNPQFATNVIAWLDTPLADVPEPASLALTGMALAGLVAARRRKQA